MHISKAHSVIITLAVAALSLPACKAKKAVVAAPVTETPVQPATPTTQAPVSTPAPVKEVVITPVEAPKPNFNFSNIQFEFDSPILKTSAYPTLDHIVAEMKKGTDAKFILNGYSSAEGTDQHNMTLSEERANSVKVYLINSGIDADRLSTKGNGERNPVADNTTEKGKALNRRVEIKRS